MRRALCCSVLVLLSACAPKPEDADAYVSDALAKRARGDNRAAEIQLMNALRINPDHADARLTAGLLVLEAGDGKLAELELRRARSLQVSEIKLLAPLARALVVQGKFQEVLDEFPLEIASANADQTELLAARGEALLGLDRVDDAREHWNSDLEIRAHCWAWRESLRSMDISNPRWP